MTKRYGALSSSVDPSKLSATVSGALKLAGGGIALLVTIGVLDSASAMILSDQIEIFVTSSATIITAGYAAYGAAQTAYGILRKIVVGLLATPR